MTKPKKLADAGTDCPQQLDASEDKTLLDKAVAMAAVALKEARREAKRWPREPPDNTVVTQLAAADYLGVSRAQFARMAAKGVVPHVLHGRRRGYRMGDLERHNRGEAPRPDALLGWLPRRPAAAFSAMQDERLQHARVMRQCLAKTLEERLYWEHYAQALRLIQNLETYPPPVPEYRVGGAQRGKFEGYLRDVERAMDQAYDSQSTFSERIAAVGQVIETVTKLLSGPLMTDPAMNPRHLGLVREGVTATVEEAFRSDPTAGFAAWLRRDT